MRFEDPLRRLAAPDRALRFGFLWTPFMPLLFFPPAFFLFGLWMPFMPFPATVATPHNARHAMTRSLCRS